MKLYYFPGACSLVDHIALIKGDLPFEVEEVDLKAKTTASDADYRSINPKGYVPALGLDNGSVLTENIAILTYIAERSGTLMPPGDLGRFRALEALAYISTELHKGYKPFFMPDSSDGDRSAAREMLAKRIALFEEALGQQPYAVGDSFSVADCYLFVMLFWAKEKAGLDVPARLSAYYDRLRDRDAVAKALTEEGLA